MATEALQPSREAPAFMKRLASSRVLIPPDALIFTSGPMLAAISFTSSSVAPPVMKPVEVLMKSAPESVTTSQAATYSSSVRRQVSIITLRSAPLLWHKSASCLSSEAMRAYLPSLRCPMLITVSISDAPSFIA